MRKPTTRATRGLVTLIRLDAIRFRILRDFLAKDLTEPQREAILQTATETLDRMEESIALLRADLLQGDPDQEIEVGS